MPISLVQNQWQIIFFQYEFQPERYAFLVVPLEQLTLQHKHDKEQSTLECCSDTIKWNRINVLRFELAIFGIV